MFCVVNLPNNYYFYIQWESEYRTFENQIHPKTGLLLVRHLNTVIIQKKQILYSDF